MSFYGEIINTGESPFVFDKIYSSRYHMERSMAGDGVYSGRFVLVSYDSSYSHNDFKRAYIKQEDKGSNKTGINLYKDSACTRIIKYKDFDEEIESAGEVLAATLSEIYYVTDGYTYTYYQCSGNVDGTAIFDYYQSMNSLLNQVYREGTDNNTENQLYWDSELTNKILGITQDNDHGVNQGDVVFVDDTAMAVSEKEREQGIFSFYECTFIDGTTHEASFSYLNTVTGHYQDETLENYIFNQKIDFIHYGEEGGVHNYDKTIWQKIYVGEKEKYIKVASLNAEFPKINLTIDAPEATISHPPYFDTDVNGQVEDLHIQPQWGLRVAAANKALSTRGSFINTTSGNYANYLEYLDSNITTYAKSILQARESRLTSISTTRAQLKQDINSAFEEDPVWSVIEDKEKVNNYLLYILGDEFGYVGDATVTADFLGIETEYLTPSSQWYGAFTDTTSGIEYAEMELQEFYKEAPSFINTIVTTDEEDNTTDTDDDNTSTDVDDTSTDVDDTSGDTSDDTSGDTSDDTSGDTSTSENTASSGNPLEDDIRLLLGKDTIDVSYFTDLINVYFNNIAAINKGFNERLCQLYWDNYNIVKDVLQGLFYFNIEEDEDGSASIILDDIVNYLEGFSGNENTEELVYNLPMIKTEDNTDYEVSDAVNIVLSKIKDIITEESDLKSDANVTWTASDPQGNLYSYDGFNWVLDEDVSLPADIYYNKAGFDYRVTSKDETFEDDITITPTGFSQIYDSDNEIWVNREYSVRDSEFANETAEYPDTQELSIHLPSIGNTISDVWDIVYGEGQEDNDYQRKTNIAWDKSSSNRTRLIHTTENGGQTYSEDELATIAGAINTTQDLIGRIIEKDINDIESIAEVDEFGNQVLTSDYIANNFNQDTIYYFSDDEKYYTVQQRYNFDNVGNSDIITQSDYEEKVQGYTEVALMNPNSMGKKDDKDLYYYDAVRDGYFYNNIYSKNRNYYTLTPVAADLQVSGYRTQSTDDLSLSYADEEDAYAEGSKYYEFTSEDILTNKYLFIPGEFYTYNDATNSFVAANKFNPAQNYYLPYVRNALSIDEQSGETIYGVVKFVLVYRASDIEVGEIRSIIVAREEDFDSGSGFDVNDYFCRCFIKTEDSDKIPEYLSGGVAVAASDDIEYRYIFQIPNKGVSYSVKPTTSNALAEDGSSVEDQEGDNIVCGILASKFDDENYYSISPFTPGKYYYAEQSSANPLILNYIKDNNSEYTPGRNYYTLQATPVYPKVYEENKYYIRDYVNQYENYVYVLSTGSFNSEETYYEHNKYFVTRDYLNHTIGEIWDYTMPWAEYQTDGVGDLVYNEIASSEIPNGNPSAAHLLEKNGLDFIPTDDTTILHYYEKIKLTSSTYVSNEYYILQDNRYTLSNAAFNSNETYYVLTDIYKPIIVTQAAYTTNTFYILDNGVYTLSTDPFDSEEQYYRNIGQEYEEIVLASSDYSTNTYYILQPAQYVKSTGSFNANETYYTEVTKKYYEGPILNDYSNVIINCNLISESEVSRIYEMQELSGFGQQFNTINGLIVKMNHLLGNQYSNDRDLDTVYGSLRKLNDEINRLGLYKTSTINDIMTTVINSFEEITEIGNELKDLRAQAAKEYGGLLTEDEAVYFYPSITDISTLLGYNLNDTTNRELKDTLYTYFENMPIGTANGNYELFVTINSINYYKQININSPTGYTQGYTDQHIGYKEIPLLEEDYIVNTYFVIENQAFVKSNEAFDANQTYYQQTGETQYPGVRTISSLNLPMVFQNSSSRWAIQDVTYQIPRTIIEEIDHKVNIESYYEDIGKVPTGMTLLDGTDPSLAQETDNETGATVTKQVYKTGSILDKIDTLEDVFQDLNETLYGSGESSLKYDLVGNWLINADPTGGGAFSYEFNFTSVPGINKTYNKLEINENGLTYYYKNGDNIYPEPIYTAAGWTTTGSEGNSYYTGVTISGSENPQALGWYESNGSQYVLTTDTTPVSYYTVENLTENTYVAGVYYLLENNNYILAEQAFAEGVTYYKKNYKSYFTLSSGRNYRQITILPNTTAAADATTYEVSSDNDLFRWLKTNAVYCGTSTTWTEVEGGIQPMNSGDKATSMFRPDSEEMKLLKEYNTKGLLARLTALDTNLTSFGAQYENLTTELKKIKEASQAVIGLTDGATTTTGIPVEHDVTALDGIDAKYGFRLVRVIQSELKKTDYTQTYNGTFVVAFTPTVNLPKFTVPFLKIANVSFLKANRNLHSSPATGSSIVSISPTMTEDGTIYLTSNGTWNALPANEAYEFVITTSFEENLYDTTALTDYVQPNYVTLNFIKDTSAIQAKSNATNRPISFKVADGQSFTTPAKPSNPLSGIVFQGWVGVNGTSPTPRKNPDTTQKLSSTDTNWVNYQKQYVTLEAGKTYKVGDAAVNELLNDDGTLRCTTFYPVYLRNTAYCYYNLAGTWKYYGTKTTVKAFASSNGSWSVIVKDTSGKASTNKKNNAQYLAKTSDVSTSKKKKHKYYVNLGSQKDKKGSTKYLLKDVLVPKTSGVLPFFKIPYYVLPGVKTWPAAKKAIYYQK